MPAVPMPIPETVESAPPRKRFTREEFERLLNTEVFDGQRYELIDGDLIDSTFGMATAQLATRQIQFHMRVQF